MKKTLYICLLAWCCAASAQTFGIAGQNLNASGTNVVVTVSTTGGHLVVIFCAEGANNTSTMSVSDSAGQSGWNQTASGYASANTSQRGAMFWRANSAALTTVTCTWSGSLSTNVEAVVFDLGGMATASPEDSSVNSTNSSSVTSLTSGTLTCTNANDMNVYGIRAGGTISAVTNGSGYTIPTNGTNARQGMQYKVVSSTQSGVTTSMSWTGANSALGIFACFKAAASAAPNCTIGLLGAGPC